MLTLGLPTILSVLITLVIAFTAHEFAHAWTAVRLGDDTPRVHGRLTLNPLAHLDPLGSALLLFAGFGWAKPVPINPYELERRTPAGPMLVAAAGPISNLLLALVAALPFQLDLVEFSTGANPFLPSQSNFLQIFIHINLILFFFNLLPVPPLDGARVLEYFIPDRWRATLYRIQPYGPMLLLFLILLGQFGGRDVLGPLILTPSRFLRMWLTT